MANFWDEENKEDELDQLAQNTLYPEAEQRASQSLENEIAAEAQPVFAPEMVSEEPAMPEVSPEMQRMDRVQGLLAELQKQRADQQQRINLARGGNDIAQAFAFGRGAKIGNASGTLDAVERGLDQPIKDYKDRIANEMDEPTSDVSKFYREQAYAILKKIKPDGQYDGKLENMSANQLLKLPGLKNALGGPTARTLQQSQFVSITNGDPYRFDPNTGDYINAVTGEKAKSGDLIRPVYVNDAFGNRVATSPAGNKVIVSSKRADITPEQMDKQASEQGFKPDEKQREALDKEKSRIDTLTKNVNEKLSAASRILGALDGDSKQAMAVIKTQMPRLAGEVGNLNQTEQEVWGGSQAWLDRAMQFLERGTESELTEDNRRELRKILGVFLQEAEGSRQSIMNNSIQSLAEIHNIPPAFSQKVYPAIKTLSPRQKEVVEGNIDTPKKQTPGKAGMKRIKTPSGKLMDIPETNLQEALRKGAVEVK